MGEGMGPKWLGLRFRGYNEAFIETRWRIVEAHPLLKLTPDFLVTHPMQNGRAGFVGVKLIPETLDGSFGLEAPRGECFVLWILTHTSEHSERPVLRCWRCGSMW